MHLQFSAEDEAFRKEVSSWLKSNLTGKFNVIKYRGGPGDENAFPQERQLWEERLYEGGWSCIGWPQSYGGRGCNITRQVIFHEEYARCGAPGRLGHIGETLLGPTLIQFGNDSQKKRFLPGILQAKEFWCQGYSEPNAGSDLANCQTKAECKNDKKWYITGQKVWTSSAHLSHYCFVLARSDQNQTKHGGLGFFLVPMQQKSVTLCPIKQITGTSEFNEIFFDDAPTCDDGVVGNPNDGWKIAMALLGFERGISTLGQQMQFSNELAAVINIAKENGAIIKPHLRQRLAKAHRGLVVMRYNSLRMLADHRGSTLTSAALIYKLYWSQWHQELGKLAMDVMGDQCQFLAGENYQLTPLQRLFLFSRSDTIYGGTNQIQRNIIAERGLGMPKEAKIES